MQYKDDQAEIATKFIPFSYEMKEEADGGRISGYASIYSNVDMGNDVVMPGAFKSALEPGQPMPKMLWQHDPTQVIGVWDSLDEDQKGLKASGLILTKIQRGAEAHVLMKHKAIDGLSIGYRVVDSERVQGQSGMIRQIKAARLYEISVVTFPMNPKSVVTDVKQLQTPREVETILRNAGVPSAFAKLVAIHGFDEAKSRLVKDQRDAGNPDDLAQKGFSQLLTEIQGLKEMMKNAQG